MFQGIQEIPLLATSSKMKTTPTAGKSALTPYTEEEEASIHLIDHSPDGLLRANDQLTEVNGTVSWNVGWWTIVLYIITQVILAF